jgi:hypothetical protein
MPTPHVQRVAWDGARTIVLACADRDWAIWFANWINAQAGPPFGQLVMQCRERLTAGYGYEAAALETGIWRVRLADLMRERPDLIEPLAAIVRDAAARVRSAA